MNDSNNIYNNNNNPTPQNNTQNPINQIPTINNSNTGFNQTPIQNHVSNGMIQPNQIPNQSTNINQQINNPFFNNGINSQTVNPIPTNSINSETFMQQQNINNNIQPYQNNLNELLDPDDELLIAFIGKNYEKIMTRPFNFAGFFFSTFYMFYRKMFGYAVLAFLIDFIIFNNIDILSITLIVNVLIGLFVNKIYLSYAKKKIAKIKASNPQMNIEELKKICSTKGGTSVGKIFLGLFTELGIGIIALIVILIIEFGGALGQLLDLSKWIINISNGNYNTTEKVNVSVNGYSCINSKCSVTIETSNGNIEDYELNVNNNEVFYILKDYKEYIKLNIYYTEKGNTKIIVAYKIYSKSTNEEFSNINTENELRDKLGLYSIGTHTDTLTLKKIGSSGFGYEDDNSYTYTEYTFIDDKNVEYEMKYINDNGEQELTEGKKYNVTFEVTEGPFKYEFTIQSIK